MKLYYSPGACSLAPHIVLQESGLAFELVKADLKTHQLAADGSDYYPIASKGQVPLLEIDSGERHRTHRQRRCARPARQRRTKRRPGA